MEALSTYFPEVKNTSRGDKYLVKEPEGIEYNTKTTIICKDCLTETFSKPGIIFWGQVPCKCGRGYYRTPERRLERLVEKVQDAPFTVDFANIPSLDTALTKVPLKCNECTFEWSPVLNSIICDNTGCPRCSKVERYSEDYYIDKINSTEGLKFVGKVTSKIGRQQKVTVQCTECENIFDSLVGNIFQGRGCSACARYGFNPSEKGFLYIHSIRKQGEVLGYKFGITNIPDDRIKRIRKRCTYDIEPIFLFSFEDGRKAAELESSIKKLYGKYFSKQEMVDGFTETVGKEQIHDLINFIHKLVNQKE